MRRAAVGLLVLGLVATGCKQVSDEEINKAMQETTAVMNGYFKAVEALKGAPPKAVAAGAAYVKANKAKLQEAGKTFAKGGTAEQAQRVEKMMNDLVALNKRKGRELGPFFAHRRDLIPELGAQVEDLLGAITPGGGGGGGSAKANTQVLQAQKQGILSSAAAFKDAPQDARDGMLDQWVKAIAESGADKAEQEAFRKELKQKLGW